MIMKIMDPLRLPLINSLRVPLRLPLRVLLGVLVGIIKKLIHVLIIMEDSDFDKYGDDKNSIASYGLSYSYWLFVIALQFIL